MVDVIAAGCDAISPSGWNADENISPSFLARARKLIGNASTTLTRGGAGRSRAPWMAATPTAI